MLASHRARPSVVGTIAGPAALALLLMTVLAPAPARGDGPGKARAIKVGEYTVTGPIAHDNLGIYMIRGPDRLKDKHYLTLQEALERKIITVHETGNVNQLMIENTSATDEVYVQSGDIVKGGRQDRTIALDFVCPPKTKLPIDAFCVEHGRWSARGKEAAAMFSSSDQQVASNALKVAVKGANDQGEVWKQVETLQGKASSNVGARVNAAESESSLQLALENKKLQQMTDAYVKEMTSMAEPADVVGYAFCINGKVKSVDVYASHELFAKLWPKLLKASAVEAVADLQKDKTFAPAPPEAVKALMEDAPKGKATDKEVTERVRFTTRETDGSLLYETVDKPTAAARPAADAWLHRNYLVKDEETKAALRAAENRRQQNDQQPARQRGVQIQRQEIQQQ